MRWTVVWIPLAEAELTRIWLATRLRGAVREAADNLDARLAHDPIQVGESREANERIAFESPLAIDFRVDEGNRKVEVLHVWTM